MISGISTSTFEFSLGREYVVSFEIQLKQSSDQLLFIVSVESHVASVEARLKETFKWLNLFVLLYWAVMELTTRVRQDY